MSKGKEVLKKNQVKWIDQHFIIEGFHFSLLVNKENQDYQIIRESDSRVIKKGSLK